jgi:hypothetical protein
VKLKSPALERQVRKIVRSEMRGDKTLWSDYNRRRRGWFRRQIERGYKYLLYVFIPFPLILAAVNGRGIRNLLVAMAFYTTATTLLRGLTFQKNALTGDERAIFLLLPVSDEDYLKRKWIQFAWSWAITFVILVIGYSGAAFASDFVLDRLGPVLLIALLQVLCGVSLSFLFLAFFPELKVVLSAVPLFAAAFACIWLSGSVIEFLWSAILLLPAGWLSHAFIALNTHSFKTGIPLVIASTTLCLPIPIAVRIAKIRMSAALRKQTADETELVLGNLEENADEDGERPDLAPTATAPQFVSRADLDERPHWESCGWIERIVGLWLNQREKLVAEFMLAQDVNQWTKRWRTATMLSAVGIAMTVLFPLPAWIPFLPMLAAAIWGAPVFGGIWPGFQGAPTFGGVIPTFAVFPLAFEEVSRVLFKANLVRLLVWAPLAIAYVVALTAKSELGPGQGFMIGVELVLFAVAIQPLMVAFKFSSGTNDTRQINLHTIALVCVAMVLTMVFVVATATFFAANALYIKLLGLLAALMTSCAAWLFYKLLFNRGRIDLLSRPR